MKHQVFKLQQYVDIYHDGNKASFGREFGRMPQSVTRLFHKPEQWAVIMVKRKALLVQIRGESK